VQSCRKQGGSFVLSDYLGFPGCNNILASLSDQPILVGADANNWAFYKSGIFSNCGNSMNLLVILVGWTERYWTAMNNWGTAWGEKGMIRLAPGNTCGICEIGVQPIVRI
jgi:hypothetical protein